MIEFLRILLYSPIFLYFSHSLMQCSRIQVSKDFKHSAKRRSRATLARAQSQGQCNLVEFLWVFTSFMILNIKTFLGLRTFLWNSMEPNGMVIFAMLKMIIIRWRTFRRGINWMSTCYERITYSRDNIQKNYMSK